MPVKGNWEATAPARAVAPAAPAALGSTRGRDTPAAKTGGWTLDAATEPDTGGAAAAEAVGGAGGVVTTSPGGAVVVVVVVVDVVVVDVVVVGGTVIGVMVGPQSAMVCWNPLFASNGGPT